MPAISHNNPNQHIEQIIAILPSSAQSRWGRERAKTRKPVIEETTDCILRISEDDVAPEEEPDFYPQ